MCKYPIIFLDAYTPKQSRLFEPSGGSPSVVHLIICALCISEAFTGHPPKSKITCLNAQRGPQDCT